MGQICKPIFEIDNASLEFELNNTQAGKNHYFRTLFPLKEVARFSVKTIEGNEGLPVAARRVAFNSKNPLFTRKEVGKGEIKLGKYAASREKDEIEIQEYRDLQAIAAQTNDRAAATECVNIAYDDVRFCEKAIPAKVEMDAMGIGSLGKQVFNTAYDGDMVSQDEIDFGVPSGNFVGASVVWSDTTNANGLKDIADKAEAIAAAGNAAPKFCYMEKSAFKKLCAQEKVAKAIFPMFKLLDIQTGGLVTLDAINNYMDKQGYPHILVIDTWVAYEDNEGNVTNVKPWNAGVVTLSLTPQLGWTYWKRKHVEEAEDKISIEQNGEFYNITIQGERNPDKVITSGEAYAQCALINRRSLVFMNTANTSWNNGQPA